jgi:hypothetical protein
VASRRRCYLRWTLQTILCSVPRALVEGGRGEAGRAGHRTDLFPHIFEPQSAQLRSVQKDLAGLGIVESEEGSEREEQCSRPEYQIDNGALAPA